MDGLDEVGAECFMRGGRWGHKEGNMLSFYTQIWKKKVLLTLYTQTSVCIFSILFSRHFLRCWQGEFSIASFVGDHFLLIFLVTLVCNSGVLLYGEIRSQSLIGVNPLTPKISFSNSPYCLPYNSCDISMENLVLEQLIIP